MSLRSEELSLLAAELNRELAGGVVQKVYAPTTQRVYLEVRVPGRSVLLLVCSENQGARISAVETRPPNPPVPPTWQSVLRTELVGAKLSDAEALATRKTLLLHLTRGDRFLTFILEASAEPTIALCTREAQVRCVSIPARSGVRVGHAWSPLNEQPQRAAPSRLQGDHVFLRLCHAAEVLFQQAEQQTWVHQQQAPLVAKLKRLTRTQTKVREEAGRSEQALRYRREGELLKKNLFRLQRGQLSAILTEYTAEGETCEVEVKLDPKRTLQQEVDWRFHQYKRLLRGAQLARERLEMLAREAAQLEARLAELESTSAESRPILAATPARRQAASGPHVPYKEYVGHGGQRIWVGRGAAHNDALTFHCAKPYHVWFHVRGLAGAHVVIPLDKNAEASGEVVLDAATLAAHHSEAKGEPRVEVSFTLVKFVRKTKGAAPGAVTYMREKTLMLRLEPQRLQRLLSTEASGAPA